jgi:hypothetical protein
MYSGYMKFWRLLWLTIDSDSRGAGQVGGRPLAEGSGYALSVLTLKRRLITKTLRLLSIFLPTGAR